MQQQQQQQNIPQPKKRQRGGLAPLLTLTTLAFVLLKTTGAVSWSWAWVLSPIWVPLAILVAVIALETISNFSNIIIEIVERR